MIVHLGYIVSFRKRKMENLVRLIKPEQSYRKCLVRTVKNGAFQAGFVCPDTAAVLEAAVFFLSVTQEKNNVFLTFFLCKKTGTKQPK